MFQGCHACGRASSHTRRLVVVGSLVLLGLEGKPIAAVAGAATAAVGVEGRVGCRHEDDVVRVDHCFAVATVQHEVPFALSLDTHKSSPSTLSLELGATEDLVHHVLTSQVADFRAVAVPPLERRLAVKGCGRVDAVANVDGVVDGILPEHLLETRVGEHRAHHDQHSLMAALGHAVLVGRMYSATSPRLAKKRARLRFWYSPPLSDRTINNGAFPVRAFHTAHPVFERGDRVARLLAHRDLDVAAKAMEKDQFAVVAREDIHWDYAIDLADVIGCVGATYAGSGYVGASNLADEASFAVGD